MSPRSPGRPRTFLRIVADVREGRHRDPLGEVADRLLDMRLAVRA